MKTAEAISRLSTLNAKKIEWYSAQIAMNTRANNETGRNEAAKKLRGYLECMKDVSIITESELRALYLYYFTNGEKYLKQYAE